MKHKESDRMLAYVYLRLLYFRDTRQDLPMVFLTSILCRIRYKACLNESFINSLYKIYYKCSDSIDGIMKPMVFCFAKLDI